MKRFTYPQSPHRSVGMPMIAVSISLIIAMLSSPSTAAQDQTQQIAVSQQILTGTCYDTVRTSKMSVDYISVWDCTIQR